MSEGLWELRIPDTLQTIECKGISKYIVSIIVLKLQIRSEKEATDYVAAFTEIRNKNTGSALQKQKHHFP